MTDSLGRTRGQRTADFVDGSVAAPEIDWDEFDGALARVAAASRDGDQGAVDDLLDEWLASPARVVLGKRGETLSARASASVIAGLRSASSALTQRDLAYLLATLGAIEDVPVADALTDTYRASRGDAARQPALLRALAWYAERSPAARPDLFAALYRVTAGDARYLRLAAVKIIGRFEGLRVDTGVRHRLTEWRADDDLAVRSEVLVQGGLLALRDALAVASTEQLRAELETVRRLLEDAVHAEELRVDAARLGSAVALVGACLPTSAHPHVDWAVVEQRADALLAMLAMAEQPWIGYATSAERVLDQRYFELADSLRAMAPPLAASSRWTNFDATLIELAAIGHLVWGLVAADDAHADVSASAWLTELSQRVVRPAVGSVLARAVTAERLRQVVVNAVLRDDVDAAVLHTLERLVADGRQGARDDASRAGDARIRPDDLVPLVREAPHAAMQIASLVPALQPIFERMGLEGLATLHPVAMPRLATDAVDFFGEDPDVHQTCERLFAATASRAEAVLSPLALRSFRRVVTLVVKSARDFRDELPRWARAETSGGEGQHALEERLRDYLYGKLRAALPSRWTDREAASVSGGRSDVRVRLNEHEVPIEVKREFVDVSQSHLRTAYLAQADRYAASRDRVGILAVLDLRVEPTDPALAMPHLSETFWVDQLMPDPMIANAVPSVVVVGLFRGNRHLPSEFSERPAPPRRPRRPRK